MLINFKDEEFVKKCSMSLALHAMTPHQGEAVAIQLQRLFENLSVLKDLLKLKRVSAELETSRFEKDGTIPVEDFVDGLILRIRDEYEEFTITPEEQKKLIEDIKADEEEINKAIKDPKVSMRDVQDKFMAKFEKLINVHLKKFHELRKNMAYIPPKALPLDALEMSKIEKELETVRIYVDEIKELEKESENVQ